jgi:hypothetical protein
MMFLSLHFFVIRAIVEKTTMQRILILTVGGSHQPLVRSIQQNRPDFTCFLCSADSGKTKGSHSQVTGPGNVCSSRFGLERPDLPNIVTQTQLATDAFAVREITEFDNLSECYLAACQWIDQLHRDHPEATILVDYTGGTKSMTAGLAAAALDDGQCEIQLVSGVRQDLVKVVDQTEFVRPVRVWDAQLARRFRLARTALSRYDYVGAVGVLEDAAARFASPATLDKVQRWLSLSRGFDAWDRFDHATAQRLLQPYRKHVVPYALVLDRIVDGKGDGFEWVEDLLQNAARRAAQQRYDDAVGRLYRALEMTVQVWLKNRYDLDTSNLDAAKVPETHRHVLDKYRDDKGIIKTPLLASWELAAAFADDPLGAHFAPLRNRLLNFLTVRNASLFAHGVRPITSGDYREHSEQIHEFIRTCITLAAESQGAKRRAALEQFPTHFGEE